MSAHSMFAVGDSARLIDSQTPGIVVAVKANDVKLRFEDGRALWFPPVMLERVRPHLRGLLGGAVQLKDYIVRPEAKQ